MKVLLCACLLFAVANCDPYDLIKDKVFFPKLGQAFELYNSGGEIRNIVVPNLESASEYDYINPDPNKHPPIFFNLYKNGKNEGIHFLKNKTATKIMDGTDSTTDYPSKNLDNTGIIYVSTSDGIYTYNPQTEEIKKFGTISEEFKAIDKTTVDQDEIYVLAGDNKIYKITSKGTVKTKVEGIDYAKDFVVDAADTIYFLDENDKPHILQKGSPNAVELTGIDFEIKNAFLSRLPSDPDDLSRYIGMAPLMIDGAVYMLFNGTVNAIGSARVEGLTAFGAEWVFAQFLGEKGRIYMHNVLAKNPSVTQQKTGSANNAHKLIFGRDPISDYNAVRAHVRH